LRAKVWLTTLSTLVAVATGAFTLRSQIFAEPAGSATASLAAYQQSVGQVCRDLNAADRARARDARRLAARLRHSRTTLAQRDALLDSTRKVLARSERELARFNGLDAPSEQKSLARTTAKAWNRGVARLRAYAQRLDAAASRAELLAAIHTLPAARTALDRDRVTRSVGLTKLASGRCILNAPIVTPTLTLPPVRRSAPVTPSVQPPAPPIVPPPPSNVPLGPSVQPPAPPIVPPPPSNVPLGPSVQPPPPPLPPPPPPPRDVPRDPTSP